MMMFVKTSSGISRSNDDDFQLSIYSFYCGGAAVDWLEYRSLKWMIYI